MRGQLSCAPFYKESFCRNTSTPYNTPLFGSAFPCLRAKALQRAGVKKGIQNQRGKNNWIPASAGMTLS
jgi:hypothetical protein